MEIEQAYRILYTVVLSCLGAALPVALVRAVTSHHIVQRLMAVNLIGTIVILLICVLTLALQEDYIADVALLYVVLSFAAVLILSRVYIDRFSRMKKEVRRGRRMD